MHNPCQSHSHPAATWVPWTPTRSCSELGDIHIKNNTCGALSLYLSGKYSFTFYLGTGDSISTVCSGSYGHRLRLQRRQQIRQPHHRRFVRVILPLKRET